MRPPCFVTSILLSVLLSSTSSGSDVPHLLLPESSCPSAGPQAVLEALRAQVLLIGKEEADKYSNILKHLKQAPDILENYHNDGDAFFGRHREILERFRSVLIQRFDLIETDVILPWMSLIPLDQIGRRSGRLQLPAAVALSDHVLRNLNETAVTEENILENISGLVHQFRILYEYYINIMKTWVDKAWPQDTKEKRTDIIKHLIIHDFPPVLGKPMMYLLQDEKREFFAPYPSGYEKLFQIFRDLRALRPPLTATSGDQMWKLLLCEIPRVGAGDAKRTVTLADREMEEERLSTHLVDLMTGYPEKKTDDIRTSDASA